jgi:amidase
VATWITRLESHGDGPRLAVKDAIDVADVVTTAGCAALADKGLPAATDAPCVASARQAGARIVGKTNLHELCFGTSGFNPWYGTPVNPVAGDRVPGGSSSGSAVAVATEEADVAYGTDTGGSVRIPAACCGVAGLKTTRGRVPLDGVWPLAPSLDTVGPLARDVEGIVSGMRLIEPGFTPSESARMVGRFRPADVDVDPALDSAVDRVLRQSGITTVEIELEGWEQIPSAFRALIMSESWQSNATLIQGFRDRVGEPVRSRLEACTELDPALIPIAVRKRERWKATIADVFTRVQAIIMPTLVGMPPLLGVDGVENILVFPWNVSGSPALALPVPIASWTMAGSMQVVGPNGSEEMLCATGAILEAAARSLERR